MSTEADVVRPLELGAVDVRTRSYPARAVQWNGTPEHAALVIEWIVSLGNSKAALIDGGVENAHIRITTPHGNRERLNRGSWVVQHGDGWHEAMTPEQYGETYLEVDDRTAALCVVAGWVLSDPPDEVKGVVDLDLKSCDSLSQAIGIAIGAASMTWPEVHGVFDSDKARDIWTQLEHEIARRTQQPTSGDGVVS